MECSFVLFLSFPISGLLSLSHFVAIFSYFTVLSDNPCYLLPCSFPNNFSGNCLALFRSRVVFHAELYFSLSHFFIPDLAVLLPIPQAGSDPKRRTSGFSLASWCTSSFALIVWAITFSSQIPISPSGSLFPAYLSTCLVSRLALSSQAACPHNGLSYESLSSGYVTVHGVGQLSDPFYLKLNASDMRKKLK